MMGFIDEELSQIRSGIKDIPNTELVACHPAMVRIKVRHTEFKQLTLCVQFPEDYPRERLIVELKTKTIPDKLIDGLVSVCDQELSKHLGTAQVLVLVRFVVDFINSNPFIVCSDELSFIKKQLHRHGDEMKVKQKTGVVQYKAYQGRYFIDFTLTVPNEYPAKHVIVDFRASNLPVELTQVITGQTTELCRQCVEPPIRRQHSDPPFQPKPSLQLIANHLVVEGLRRYPQEQCPLCKERALPDDPKNVVKESSHPQYVYRVYCSHLYHNGCLETYMKTPPFEGGKKCLKCGERIFHDKWNVHPKLAEERWAHQEARRREVAEVAEFLGFD